MQNALPCPFAPGAPTRAVVLLAGALLLAACGGPDPKTAKRAEEVPANSEAETRRQNEEKLRAAEAAEAEERDKPKYGRVPTSDGDGAATSAPAGGSAARGATDPPAPAAKGGKPAAPAKSAASAGGGGKVSKAECGKLFDKYIDLEVASNPAFQGLGAELKGMIDSAKKQALAQKGDPCDSQEVSRAQYDCAINARSTDEWKRCLK